MEWVKLNKSVSLPYVRVQTHRAVEGGWLLVGTLGHLVDGKFWMKVGQKMWLIGQSTKGKS